MAKSRTSFTSENNPTNGRPKGAQNKVTKKAKEAFITVMELLEKRMTDSTDVIDNLTPARAAELYVNLLNYVKPKLSMNKNENDNVISGGLDIVIRYTDDKTEEEKDGE